MVFSEKFDHFNFIAHAISVKQYNKILTDKMTNWSEMS